MTDFEHVAHMELPISLPGEELQPRAERDMWDDPTFYYDPHGRPLTGSPEEQSRQWGAYKQSRKWDHKTSLWFDGRAINVSTVYLGIDHGWSVDVPLIYETMVFADLSWIDEACWRYATPSAALDGHRRVVEALVELGAEIVNGAEAEK